MDDFRLYVTYTYLNSIINMDFFAPYKIVFEFKKTDILVMLLWSVVMNFFFFVVV